MRTGATCGYGTGVTIENRVDAGAAEGTFSFGASRVRSFWAQCAAQRLVLGICSLHGAGAASQDAAAIATCANRIAARAAKAATTEGRECVTAAHYTPNREG